LILSPFFQKKKKKKKKKKIHLKKKKKKKATTADEQNALNELAEIFATRGKSSFIFLFVLLN